MTRRSWRAGAVQTALWPPDSEVKHVTAVLWHVVMELLKLLILFLCIYFNLRVHDLVRAGRAAVVVGWRGSGATSWSGRVQQLPVGEAGGERPAAAAVPPEQSRWSTGLPHQWVGPWSLLTDWIQLLGLAVHRERSVFYRQDRVEKEALAAAVSSLLFTCQPYFNHLESTARSTMSHFTHVPADMCSKVNIYWVDQLWGHEALRIVWVWRWTRTFLFTSLCPVSTHFQNIPWTT